jgi:hypothetical protein
MPRSSSPSQANIMDLHHGKNQDDNPACLARVYGHLAYKIVHVLLLLLQLIQWNVGKCIESSS